MIHWDNIHCLLVNIMENFQVIIMNEYSPNWEFLLWKIANSHRLFILFFYVKQIVTFAKNCNMKYLIVTAKHYDVFRCTILILILMMFVKKPKYNLNCIIRKIWIDTSSKITAPFQIISSLLEVCWIENKEKSQKNIRNS